MRHRDCDSVFTVRTMKNVTLSVPDDVYRSARIRAAERGSSVSALVGEYLRSLPEREAEFSRLEAQQQHVQEEIRRFSGRDRLGRDELHTHARFVDMNVLLYAISRDPRERDKAERANERFPVQAITTGVLLAALATRQRLGISYWDAAILEAGHALGCDRVLSEDLSDGEDYAGVRVENPFGGR